MSKKSLKSKHTKNAAKKAIKRRGVILVIVLASLILMVSIITTSFSWFEPQEVTSNGMKYLTDTNLRSENCTFVTYAGTKQSNDSISYNENTAITSSEYHLTAGTVYYFKTKITNHDPKFASNVSMFFETFPANTKLSVTFPSNTDNTTGSGGASDFRLIRNAYVKPYVSTDADGPGLLEVEWFIVSSSNTTIDFTKLYLMYN